jgi:hypothetical protein
VIEPSPHDLTFRDKGLQAAIALILLFCVARFCNRHLLGNVKGEAFNDKEGECLKHYWGAVHAKKEEQFLYHMEKLKILRPVGYEYLMNEKKLPRSMWADHAFFMRTWKSHTNNLAERSIHWMGILRAKSPVCLLKILTTKMMTQRARRLIKAEARIKEVNNTVDNM